MKKQKDEKNKTRKPLEPFKNRAQVAKYLKEAGYKITEKTFYNHVDAGRIKPDVGVKGFSLKNVKTYALGLDRVDTLKSQKEEERYNKKSSEQTLKIKAERRLIELKLMREQSKVIDRDDFYREMAARAAVLENDFKGMLQMRATEFVKLVDGNRQKTGELTRELLIEFDRMLNEFATTKEFKVIFEGIEDGSTTGS